MEQHPHVSAAIEKLSRDRIRIADAPTVVPRRPGLYAIYGADSVWDTLGVTSIFENGPLYIGRSENNLLVRRDQAPLYLRCLSPQPRASVAGSRLLDIIAIHGSRYGGVLRIERDDDRDYVVRTAFGV